ncbi:MAG: molybdopterin molybdotransferase MoeA [Chloroflexi bacterium]|nr:molybdopterin molybdotransferase MoeA [Chloroflexota bacterium]
MDGYAVQANSTTGATSSNPKLFKVIGEVAAGAISNKTVIPGTAVRIMTGAPVPAGADAVIQFELTDETTRSKEKKPLNEINIQQEIGQGNNIRPVGEDIAKGSMVMKKETVIRPQEIGILASLGFVNILVIRRPVVAVLATGDEIVNPGEPLPPGKIYNTNTYSLASEVTKYGGIPKILGIAKDNVQALSRMIGEGAEADMLITSGGVSMGDYDMVKNVLAERGEIAFWTVCMKPGKPLAFGTLKSKTGKKVPHLGLPGYPVSAMVAFEQFGRPAILKMLGKTNYTKPTIQAICEDEIKNKDGRRVYTRVVVRKEKGGYYASIAGAQGSAVLTTMGMANGLMITPENISRTKKGDIVQVQMLDWNEGQEC